MQEVENRFANKIRFNINRAINFLNYVPEPEYKPVSDSGMDEVINCGVDACDEWFKYTKMMRSLEVGDLCYQITSTVPKFRSILIFRIEKIDEPALLLYVRRVGVMADRAGARETGYRHAVKSIREGKEVPVKLEIIDYQGMTEEIANMISSFRRCDLEDDRLLIKIVNDIDKIYE